MANRFDAGGAQAELYFQKVYSLINQVSITENELWGVQPLLKREKAFVNADPDQQGRDTIRRPIRLSTRAQARLKIYRGIRGMEWTAPKKLRNIHKDFSAEQIREANETYDKIIKKKAKKPKADFTAAKITYPHLQNGF